MQLHPYLNLNGQCEEAFKFYEQFLGDKIGAMITHEEAPAADKVPDGWGKRTIHARLTVGDKTWMSSDVPPDCYHEPKGCSVMLGVEDPADAERIFNALVKKGTGSCRWSRHFGPGGLACSPISSEYLGRLTARRTLEIP